MPLNRSAAAGRASLLATSSPVMAAPVATAAPAGPADRDTTADPAELATSTRTASGASAAAAGCPKREVLLRRDISRSSRSSAAPAAAASRVAGPGRRTAAAAAAQAQTVTGTSRNSVCGLRAVPAAVPGDRSPSVRRQSVTFRFRVPSAPELPSALLFPPAAAPAVAAAV